MSFRQSDDDEDHSEDRHPSSSTSGQYDYKLGGKRDHREKKRKSRENLVLECHSKSRSRSKSRERRRSRSRERSRHHQSSSSSSHHSVPKDSSSRRHSPDRGKSSQKSSSHYRKRERRSRSRSRSSSTERHERNNERSKLQLRQQMARNYEEQIEKLKNNQFGPLPTPNNPKPVNHQVVPVEPSKLVEQIEKRKFLFSKKDKPADVAKPSCTVWKQPAFSDDSDGKMTAKFKRLMGMKDDDAAAPEDPSSAAKRQEDYFTNLEKQYEVARATTHTQRGLGLGFSSKF